MDHYKALNGVLVGLFREIMDIEGKAIITEEFKDITNNDMHVIEAIGVQEPRNMSSIARAMDCNSGHPYDCHEQSGKKRVCHQNPQ